MLLPARNLKDLRDVPEETRSAMHFVPLETVDDAIGGALAEAPARRAPLDFSLR